MIYCENDECISKKQPALKRFCYANGYHLEGTDFGPLGVKIELSHPYEGKQALILPPDKVRECALWLIRTLKQQKRGWTKNTPHAASRQPVRTSRKRAS